MAENGSTKPQSVPSKSFMTVGPTLHYSHANVHLCWGLSIAVYLVACFLWSRLLIGEDLSVSLLGLFHPEYWNLGRFCASPLSIYEYPWQIAVLGILMGILATTPVLTSQLLSFRYSVPMILLVMLVARLGCFGLFLTLSCIAVACRPLRFRSRFISVALCMAPQIIYWTIWGGYQSSDPLRWGFSYAPWVTAWLGSLFISGCVLATGHFSRYKPGLVWSSSVVMLAAASGIFYFKIGFAELDYQLYVANNNPEEIVEFHDHSLAEILDEIVHDDTMSSFLAGRFYPTEPLQLREKLKADIQTQLVYGQWPQWIQKKLPESCSYQTKRNSLLSQYELFIERWPRNKRMPISLYYKSLLNETHPDVRRFGETEILHFYNDYPYYENILLWQDLYDRFPTSPESLEARWRIAMHEAGLRKFEKAQELCDVAISLCAEQINRIGAGQSSLSGLFSAFIKPAENVMTAIKLHDLSFRLKKLRSLINKDNQGNTPQSRQRLAEFVMMNPYRLDYEAKLTTLLAAIEEKDPLRDNILLAQAMIMTDPVVKLQKYNEISTKYQGTDAGIQVLYETAILKIGVWKNPQNQPELKKTAITEAKELLNKLCSEFSTSLWAEQAKNMLTGLPSGE